MERGLLMRIFGPKRNEVTGARRKLHNEELHNVYPSPSVIRTESREMILAEHVAKLEVKGKG
jgi:hypothetical protein